ncbi:SNARE protein SED5/Syntaxin 5 [Phaffia rhodozyma]|uniref:SNARE protein SED5/Syntaxin 5 n=1 Tax=Phaffia rhodozyma TaxID=264483 RepID=A0A0F7SEF6_PHARH|nr:SNARE protein SED5/Syntaxin 5 [Phaffia rhodozyma]
MEDQAIDTSCAVDYRTVISLESPPTTAQSYLQAELQPRPTYIALSNNTTNSQPNRSPRSGQTASSKGKGNQAKQPSSQVASLAAGIARDINATTGKLQKLAQLAKRKTLFDDRPVEISELTYIIKQDISDLNTQIASLQQLTKSANAANASSSGSSGSGKKQVEEHNSNVVMLLQSKLADMGMGFKDVLEIRTQNMKASKDRTEQFMYSASSSNSLAPAQSILNAPPTRPSSTSPYAPSSLQPNGQSSKASSSLPGSRSSIDGGSGFPIDKKGKGKGDYLALDMDRPQGGDGKPGSGQASGGMQQMMMMEEQDDYINQRSTAIETIESTIAELGTIFTQLAGMVAEQRETVQRIDADVSDISNNVSGAQRELLKYYASVSGNRWLMLKIFGVLIIFFLLFILVT